MCMVVTSCMVYPHMLMIANAWNDVHLWFLTVRMELVFAHTPSYPEEPPLYKVVLVLA